MRYYSIVITDSGGNLIQTASSVPGSGATYTSYAGGRSIPGALQVELDVPVTAYAAPIGAAFVRVWGITVAEISEATQLNPRYAGDGTATYFNVKVFAGMQRGLPLAN